MAPSGRSPFDELFGYHAKGVDEKTAILPSGWRDRLVKIQNKNTDLRIGLCLETHDLACSKLAAGRKKDFDFMETLIEEKLLNRKVLEVGLKNAPIEEIKRQRLLAWCKAKFQTFLNISQRSVNPRRMS